MLFTIVFSNNHIFELLKSELNGKYTEIVNFPATPNESPYFLYFPGINVFLHMGSKSIYRLSFK